ncbi:hypothetical protein BOTBODRAFT_181312 [Botryobasidium botryosum FD-172 SS1]|uniref:Thioredoxin n=1 Tax=Botryobasidium botryosum (strain FD-172 SS1) TaxID=930990 RepID=A0A067M4C7_BOTB1|nr:hypothetical protein BOTBODRAFT_181312 [Botryobasidium botryosum FD-172 SS1]
MPTEIKSYEQYQQVTNSGKVVIIDFTATWCPPCNAIAPYFEKFSKEYSEVEFYKVDIDVDQVQGVVQELGVRAMPTFKVFKDGVKIGELLGANEKGLENLVKAAAAQA